MATVMQGAGKTTGKRSSRKVLGDKTNAAATPVPAKSPKKAVKKTPTKAVQEQEPATPVVVRGEDLLRSIVHSKLDIVLTPEGVARQSPEAETPQFGTLGSPSPVRHPARDTAHEVAVDVDVSPLPHQVRPIAIPLMSFENFPLPAQVLRIECCLMVGDREKLWTPQL